MKLLEPFSETEKTVLSRLIQERKSEAIKIHKRAVTIMECLGKNVAGTGIFSTEEFPNLKIISRGRYQIILDKQETVFLINDGRIMKYIPDSFWLHAINTIYERASMLENKQKKEELLAERQNALEEWGITENDLRRGKFLRRGGF